MSNEIKHDLIVAVVNQGYSNELITAARGAGAYGGTVISARGMTHDGPVKFFGLSLQEDKEIILILAEKEQKLPVMQKVSLDFGISTQAEGIVFSLPVDALAARSPLAASAASCAL
ncbi:MAG: hypothetical protein LBC88_08260 [Spirochaetaceae bacterium]|jgi:hypothetical protein|nr:hypothetical protein [Spirochaetaceae bacterium]